MYCFYLSNYIISMLLCYYYNCFINVITEYDMNDDDYGVTIDSEVLGQDFDDVDLYGERTEDELPDSDIEFE